MWFEVALLLFVAGATIAVLVAFAADWSPSDLPGPLALLVWPLWWVVLCAGGLPALVLAAIWSALQAWDKR